MSFLFYDRLCNKMYNVDRCVLKNTVAVRKSIDTCHNEAIITKFSKDYCR